MLRITTRLMVVICNSQMLPEVPSLSFEMCVPCVFVCNDYLSGTFTIHTYHSERQEDSDAEWSSASIGKNTGLSRFDIIPKFFASF